MTNARPSDRGHPWTGNRFAADSSECGTLPCWLCGSAHISKLSISFRYLRESYESERRRVKVRLGE